MTRPLDKAIALIKKYEPYHGTVYDDVGYPAIGYGHRIVPGELFVSLTETEASALIDTDLRSRVRYVESVVKVPLNDNQFNALVDFVYNVGAGAFRDSTLLELLNQGKYTEASDQLLLWHHYTNAAGEKVDSPALLTRRQEELELFRSSEKESTMPTEEIVHQELKIAVRRATGAHWNAKEVEVTDSTNMDVNIYVNAFRDGKPAFGEWVHFWWPYWKEDDHKDQQLEMKDGVPRTDFPMSGDSSYDPAQGQRGPYGVKMLDGASDEVIGMGLPLKRHIKIRCVFEWVEGTQPPIEPPIIPPTNDYVTMIQLREFCKDYMTRSEMRLFLDKWKNDLSG